MFMDALHRFPEESSIIGRLLVGYADLELDLLNCASMAHENLDATFKAMFRARGERHRVGVADAICRGNYRQLGLETELSTAISETKYCLKIRNTYAHCLWHDDLSGKLAYVNLEEIAEQNAVISDLGGLTTRYVDVALLSDQERFFSYAGSLLRWVNHEAQQRGGKTSILSSARPKQIRRPPLHNP